MVVALIKRVLRSCRPYFCRNRNYYWDWINGNTRKSRSFTEKAGFCFCFFFRRGAKTVCLSYFNEFSVFLQNYSFVVHNIFVYIWLRIILTFFLTYQVQITGNEIGWQLVYVTVSLNRYFIYIRTCLCSVLILI